jgi:hypothetical protein
VDLDEEIQISLERYRSNNSNEAYFISRIAKTLNDTYLRSEYDYYYSIYISGNRGISRIDDSRIDTKLPERLVNNVDVCLEIPGVENSKDNSWYIFFWVVSVLGVLFFILKILFDS